MPCGLCGRSGHNRRTCSMPDVSPTNVTSGTECNIHHCFCKNKHIVLGIARRSEMCPWVRETKKQKKTIHECKRHVILNNLMDAVTEFWIEWNYSAYDFGREEWLGDYDDL